MQWYYLCHHPETCAAFSRWGRCFPMRVMIPESQMRTTNQEWGEWGEGTHSISDPVFNASHVLPFSPSCSQWLERGVVPQRQCTGAGPLLNSLPSWSLACISGQQEPGWKGTWDRECSRVWFCHSGRHTGRKLRLGFYPSYWKSHSGMSPCWFP